MKPKQVKILIWSVTVAALILISFLSDPRGGPTLDFGDFDTYIFPKINAVINSVVALLLILALGLIKQGKEKAHRNVMLITFGLSAIFLIFYVLYHASTPHTHHCSESAVSYGVYIFILASHIILSIAIIPLVLFSIFYGWTDSREKHRKIAKITWPIWLYISVTGVLTFLFISPCYPSF